jgi:hypothetical protein
MRIQRVLLLIILSVILSAGCAPARKNPYYEKRIKASHSNTKQLGRNRYFFSKTYQKKLTKSFKRKDKY